MIDNDLGAPGSPAPGGGDGGDTAIADALAAARLLLRVRLGASSAEVRAGYRATLLALRPDLPGRVDGAVMQQVLDARDLLLRHAGTDRRRRPRPRDAAPPPAAVVPLRRATWGLAETPADSGPLPRLDGYL
jgi:hypothetical protein